MNQPTTTIVVHGLWKVFGSHPERILASPWRLQSRQDVQAETGNVIALRDVTFEVGQGETFVVMGLSGSGKSTLARCILRLIEPNEGEIVVDGEDVRKFSSAQLTQFRRRKTAMVFQRFGLLPHRTVVENVAFGLEIQGVTKRVRLSRAQGLLDLVDLRGWENNYPHELSGGMQQRVGLARALAGDPEILVMDEPFSALDPLIRREMQDELARLQRQLRKTIVFITHDLDEALKLGTRIAIMRDGAVIQMGTPEEIIMTPSDSYVGEFTRNVRKAAILQVRAVMKDPSARLYIWQSPRLALHEMTETGQESLFVVDESEKLIGVVTKMAALEGAKRRTASVGDLLEDVPIAVHADVALDSLMANMVDFDWRIEVLPVIDRDGSLVGELSRNSVRSLFDQDGADGIQSLPRQDGPTVGTQASALPKGTQ